MNNPLLITCAFLVFFYAFLVLIVPVDLSFDAANYYLPQARGILQLQHLPSEPLTAYKMFGGQPSTPPALAFVYSYILNFYPNGDSFKLVPLLFFLHFVLATSLLGKEIFPTLRSSWIALTILVMPVSFIYLSTTAYNADLPFYSFFISAIYFIIKCTKRTNNNLIWSIFAGGSLSAMILMRDVGILFALPALAILLLGFRRKFPLWIVPLSLLMVLPLSFVLSPILATYYLQHSMSLIVIQAAIIFLVFILVHRLQLVSYIAKVPFVSMLLPSIIFTCWSTMIWGSPVIRTQIGFLAHTAINYSWATNIAVNNLGSGALPILPQTAVDMMLNFVFVFLSPVMGSVFVVPKILGVITSLRKGSANKRLRLPVILFLVTILIWLSAFGGFNYSDFSAFRHVFDIIAILSILSVIGISSFLNLPRIRDLVFALAIVVIFMIQMITYSNYNTSLFSLSSRILTNEPYLRFTITSIAIFVAMYFGASELTKFNDRRSYKWIVSSLIIVILVASVVPTVYNSLYVIAANDGSYEKTLKFNLSTIPYYKNILKVHEFFNSIPVNGSILAYGIDSLNYRTHWKVLEMRAIIDLAILKDMLDTNSVQNAIENIKANGIRYIVIPIGGEAYDRFQSLYGSTQINNVLKRPFSTQTVVFGNYAIFKVN